ncbi:unnamed protein product [Dovyalis caffra]|uniref:Uncharacterized protein n=1 Tax=Dovyalis caffra TaxID=77055 RepID=A0AAV1SF74_9ROSI|nr:unnamed protein product [Dovyalis caffra]
MVESRRGGWLLWRIDNVAGVCLQWESERSDDWHDGGFQTGLKRAMASVIEASGEFRLGLKEVATSMMEATTTYASFESLEELSERISKAMLILGEEIIVGVSNFAEIHLKSLLNPCKVLSGFGSTIKSPI